MVLVRLAESLPQEVGEGTGWNVGCRSSASLSLAQWGEGHSFLGQTLLVGAEEELVGYHPSVEVEKLYYK